jgi:hypothetical protein
MKIVELTKRSVAFPRVKAYHLPMVYRQGRSREVKGGL